MQILDIVARLHHPSSSGSNANDEQSQAWDIYVTGHSLGKLLYNVKYEDILFCCYGDEDELM